MDRMKPLLLVEDDYVDALTVKRAFKELEVHNPIIHKEDGEQALEFLSSDDLELPKLILLDLNMPKMNGIEFLEKLRSNESLKKIPVVVLTTSKNQQDRFETFDLGIAGYMVKPLNYQDFIGMMKTINEYWNISEQP